MGKGKKNTEKKVNISAVKSNNINCLNDGSVCFDTWSNNEEIPSLKNELSSLRARVESLENQVVVLKSEQAITSTINSRLVDHIDKLDAYSRRSCLVLSNAPAVSNESSSEIERKVRKTLAESGLSHGVVNNIDKLHPIGEIRGNKQKIIIRFKSHSSRYNLYRNKKKLPSNIKVSPSLTKRRQKILSEANEMINRTPEIRSSVNFVFADIHGDLKVRLNEADKTERYVLNFNSTEHLAEIIRGLDFCEFDVGSEGSDSESVSDSEL